MFNVLVMHKHISNLADIPYIINAQFPVLEDVPIIHKFVHDLILPFLIAKIKKGRIYF